MTRKKTKKPNRRGKRRRGWNFLETGAPPRGLSAKWSEAQRRAMGLLIQMALDEIREESGKARP